jgi:hypothetical protein
MAAYAVVVVVLPARTLPKPRNTAAIIVITANENILQNLKLALYHIVT